MMNRRDLIKLIGAVTAAGNLPSAYGSMPENTPITKKIPSSGEAIPVVGMGTSRTFDQIDNKGMHEQLLNVLVTFFKQGGTVIDSSPMYGSAEMMLGYLLAKLDTKPDYFAASKIWTYGKEAGIKAVADSADRMGVDTMDLMAVHNLRDIDIHMETLKEMKAAGKIRYIGITTSRTRQYEDFEKVMKAQPLDFVQLNYSLGERESEQRLLPLAQENGIAVMVNRPFQRAQMFGRVKGKALSGYAAELGITSWAQFFLKFIISHPAVTCVIPATSKVKHMHDNMQAQFGELPDANLRQKMLSDFMAI